MSALNHLAVGSDLAAPFAKNSFPRPPLKGYLDPLPAEDHAAKQNVETATESVSRARKRKHKTGKHRITKRGLASKERAIAQMKAKRQVTLLFIYLFSFAHAFSCIMNKSKEG